MLVKLKYWYKIMTQWSAITGFDFETVPVNQKTLIQAWLPEIEIVAWNHEPNVARAAFMIAVWRLGKDLKAGEKITLEAIIKLSGYGRATFFRLFGNKNDFLLEAYQIICSLSVEVYAKYLNQQQLNVAEFSKFTIDIFYGANCCFSKGFHKALWDESTKSHREFHPYLIKLTQIIFLYLTQNSQTKHLKIDVDELDGVLKTLDLDFLHSRLEDDRHWGTPVSYQRIRRMLEGYLLSRA